MHDDQAHYHNASWKRPLLRALTELRETPYASGLIAGLGVAGAARIAGYNGRRPAGFLGATAAAAVWYGRHAVNHIEREVRSAQDAAVIVAALGEASPFFGRWAIEADFAGIIARELEVCPDLVVECGSGSTTVVIASKLTSNGRGQLISLEHDPLYAERTRRLLRNAGLDDVVCVVVAPLEIQRIGGRSVLWYEPRAVNRAIEGEIDLLVVDGPPQLSRWSRWPALELLHPHLSPSSVVLLDDGRTKHARRTVMAWNRTFADMELYWIDSVKGTWMLKPTLRIRGSLFDSFLAIARTLNPRPSGFGRWPVRR